MIRVLRDAAWSPFLRRAGRRGCGSSGAVQDPQNVLRGELRACLPACFAPVARHPTPHRASEAITPAIECSDPPIPDLFALACLNSVPAVPLHDGFGAPPKCSPLICLSGSRGRVVVVAESVL